MTNEVRVLDHGYVRLRNIAGLNGPGTDRDPANSARVSFDAEGKKTEADDLRLAEYLMKNKHTSPFEMVEIWLEMKLPIFVARQFVRHRTVSINEVSARYIQLPREWYIPKPEHVGKKPDKVKQGRDEAEVTKDIIYFLECLNDNCNISYIFYEQAIEKGIPPELARCFLHLNHYTHWIWKQDLHNIMHFLSLRDHSHAQFESQEYARAITQLLRQQLPHSMELYDKYRRMPG